MRDCKEQRANQLKIRRSEYVCRGVYIETKNKGKKKEEEQTTGKIFPHMHHQSLEIPADPSFTTFRSKVRIQRPILTNKI